MVVPDGHRLRTKPEASAVLTAWIMIGVVERRAALFAAFLQASSR
jgi:hypothetical protein